MYFKYLCIENVKVDILTFWFFTKFHDFFKLAKSGLAFGMYIFAFWISLLVFTLSIVVTFGVNFRVIVAFLDASLLKLSNCFHYFYVEAGGYRILHA